MKSVRIAAFASLLVSVAAFAVPAPSPAPLSDTALAVILGEPPGGSTCAAQAQPAARTGSGIPAAKAACTAIASCAAGGTVTCTGTSCVSMDANCSWLEAGWVQCNGVVKSCTPGCCSTGTQRDRACCRCAATAGCFDCCRCDGGTGVQCSLQCG